MMLRHLALVAVCLGAAGQQSSVFQVLSDFGAGGENIEVVEVVPLRDEDESRQIAELRPSTDVNNFELEAELDEEHVKLGTQDSKQGAWAIYLRWIWWLVVLYFFWAQAEVCDEFFVPTIEVIVDTFKIPEDVAGATIMALGCNGPELFLNLIAIKTGSDIGIGAVIGGEVFNVLVLVGCSLLATPMMYMPLRLAKFSYTRDVVWYAYSIAALYAVLKDGKVTILDGIFLFVSGICYSTFVAFSGRLRSCVTGKKEVIPAQEALMPASDHTVDAALNSNGGSGSESTLGTLQAQAAEVGRSQQGPKTGCSLSIRVQLDNRMLDRGRHWDTRFVTLGASGLLISTEVQPSSSGRTARGIVYQHDLKGGAWRHAGIVNAPTTLEEDRETRAPLSYTPEDGLPRVSNNPGALIVDKDTPVEVVPCRDFVSCVPPDDPSTSCFELLVVQRNDYFGKVIRLEFDCKTVQMRERWQAAIMHAMTETLRDLANHSLDPQSNAAPRPPSFIPGAGPSLQRHHAGHSSGPSCLREWLDWFCFPVRSLLKATIPDVHKPHLRKYYPLSFLMCMAWLGVFAFGVISVCEVLHEEFGISNGILGFTVAAIGTSLPNVVSCVAVSKQGRTAMAVANSLGANIQNVFLALAIPWIIQASISEGQFFKPKVNALTNAVAWMFGTLALMVIIVMSARCRMPKWAGVIFLITYVVFLVFQLAVEITGYDCWPLREPTCDRRPPDE